MQLINQEQLQEKLEKSPAPRVTQEYIESRIAKTTFATYPFAKHITVCQLELDNGYSVRGESACVNPENYDEQIGQRIAFNKAFDQLWPLFGFLLAELKALPQFEQVEPVQEVLKDKE